MLNKLFITQSIMNKSFPFYWNYSGKYFETIKEDDLILCFSFFYVKQKLFIIGS